MKMTARRSFQAGFTLLEAIVALTLLSVVAGTLLVWLNTNIKSLERIESADRRLLALQNATDYLNTVNPMQTPTGEMQLGQILLQWQSEPISGVKLSRNATGSVVGIFNLQLFRVDATVSAPDLPAHEFVLERLGHERRRQRDTFE